MSGPRGAGRAHRGLAVGPGVALAAAALYVLTACPTIYFGDSGELIAASAELGVAHPPGYPLYTILGRLALTLPIGEAAWRMNVLSGLFGALACGLLADLVRRWSGSAAAGVTAAACLGLAPTFWLSSVVAEVYTLDVLAGVGVLWLAERSRSVPAAIPAAAAVLGMGLAHRPSIVLVVPAALWLACSDRATRRMPCRPGRGRLLASTLLLALPPALLYASLLLPARAGARASWGSVDGWSSLVAHVSTRGYSSYVLGPAGWLSRDGWEALLRLLWEDLGPVGLPLALGGVVLGIASGAGLRRPTIAATLLAVPATLFGLSYGTGDVQVLFLPLFTALAGLAGVAVAVTGRTRRSLGILLSLLALALPLVRHHQRCDLRTVVGAADYGRDMLRTVPRDGVLFVEGDDGFLLAYLTQVLGLRRDVKIYDRHGLLFDDLLAERGSRRRPGETPSAYRVRRESEWLVAESRRPRPRAVLFMSWPGYPAPPGLVFRPEGLFYRVAPAGSAASADTLWADYRDRRVLADAERTGDPLALAAAATYPLMQGERDLFAGRRRAARARFERAATIGARCESIQNYLGAVYGRLGDYERAIRSFEAAVRLRPVSVRAWNNLALARGLAGDAAGRVEALERSLAIDPHQPDVRGQLAGR